MELKFKRGDRVNFKGVEKGYRDNGVYEPVTLKPATGTYVWAVMLHLMIRYVIEHPEGEPRENFFAKPPFPDGFEAIHSSLLQEGLTYAYVAEADLEFFESA